MCHLFYNREKKMLLSPKLDILQKHVGCCMIIVATTNVVIGDWFYSKDAFCNKMKRSIQIEAMSWSFTWFRQKLMEVPKTIDSICKHLSFVKPWLILIHKISSF